MKVLVTGGGTGGHIYPGIAIAQAIMEKYPTAQISFVGTDRGLEAELVPRAGFPFLKITVAGLQRKLTLKNVQAIGKLGAGLLQAWRIIRREKPELVIGTGGYVCGPVVMMAALAGIPTLIHEQNAMPGLTNRILSHFVDAIAITYAESIPYFPKRTKISKTGNPIRTEILTTDRITGCKNLGIAADKTVLLIFGGSRGARSINQTMCQAIPHLIRDPKFHVLFITGKNDYQKIVELLPSDANNLTVLPYLFNMQDALAASDLIISRAGATTLAEITAKGISAILVPYPYATGNHQEHNARVLEKAGAARVVLDNELNSEKLVKLIKEIGSNEEMRAQMSKKSRELSNPHAARQIAEAAIALLGKK